MKSRRKNPIWRCVRLGFLLVVSLGVTRRGSSQADVLYVPSIQGLGLIEIDLGRGGSRRIAKTALFNNTLVAANPSRPELYVAAINGDAVSVVDPALFREIAIMRGDVGWNTQSMVVSHDGKNLYLGCSQRGDKQFSRVVAFDLVTRRHVATALVNGYEAAEVFLALSPDGHKLYESSSDFISEYEVPGLRRLATGKYPPGWGSSRLALSSDGLSLFAAQRGQLLRLRTGGGGIESSISLPDVDARSHIQLARDGSAVFVPGRSAIYRVPLSLDGYSTVSTPKEQKGSPFEFAESSDGRMLYVLAGTENADLWIIDISTQRLVQTIGGIPYPASVLALAKGSEAGSAAPIANADIGFERAILGKWYPVYERSLPHALEPGYEFLSDGRLREVEYDHPGGWTSGANEAVASLEYDHHYEVMGTTLYIHRVGGPLQFLSGEQRYRIVELKRDILTIEGGYATKDGGYLNSQTAKEQYARHPSPGYHRFGEQGTIPRIPRR